MFRSFAKATVLYGVGIIAAGLIGFAFLPVFTRLLSPDDFGMLGVIASTLGVLTVVVGLNPVIFFTEKYSVLPREDLKAYTGVSLLLTAATSVIAFVVLVSAARLFEGFPVSGTVCAAMVAMAAFRVVQTLVLTFFVVQKRPLAYSVVQCLTVGFGAAIALALITTSPLDDWRGRFAGDLIGSTVLSAALLVYLVRADLVGLGFRGEHVKKYLWYTGPLVIHALGFWAINAQDRYFVAGMVGLDAAGLYQVAYSLASVLNLAHAAAARAFNPYFFENARKEEGKREIVVMSYSYFALSGLALVVFVAGAKWVLPFLVGEKFHGAEQFILWLSIGYTFNSVRNFVAGYLYIAGRTRLLASLTLFAAIVNGVANYLFIGWFGAVGAAMATALAFGLLTLLTVYFAVRSHPMPWLEGLRWGLRRLTRGGGG
jgi:O-antigen/teichoic acid export membrane protein